MLGQIVFHAKAMRCTAHQTQLNWSVGINARDDEHVRPNVSINSCSHVRKSVQSPLFMLTTLVPLINLREKTPHFTTYEFTYWIPWQYTIIPFCSGCEKTRGLLLEFNTRQCAIFLCMTSRKSICNRCHQCMIYWIPDILPSTMRLIYLFFIGLWT